MKKKILLFGLMMASMASLPQAQERPSGPIVPEEVLDTPQRLSLEEAVDFAVQHNKSLQISNLDVDLQQKKILEAISAGIPQINANINYSTNFGQEMSLGGTGMNIKMEDNMNLNANAQWLFSGQWIVGIQTSKIAKTLAAQQTEISALEIRGNIYNSYYTVLVCEHLLEILQENLKNMEEILAHTENMYKAGSLEISDVDQIRITVGQLNNSKLSMERTVDVNYNMLRIQLGLKAGTPIVLTDPLEKFLHDDPFSFWIGKEFDVNENLDYQATLTQERLQKKALTSAYLACVPTLGAGYTYQYQIIEGGFMNIPHTATVTLNVPIFAGLQRSSQISQAKIGLQQTRLGKSLLEDQLALQESQYRYNLQNASENFKLQKENVEVAKSVLGHYQAKFRAGAISSLDLTQANNNYLRLPGPVAGADRTAQALQRITVTTYPFT